MPVYDRSVYRAHGTSVSLAFPFWVLGVEKSAMQPLPSPSGHPPDFSCVL